MKFKNFCIHILFLLATPVITPAMVELESVGTVYPVIEPDVRIEMKQQAGEKWKDEITHYQEKVKQYQPPNLQRLPKAKQNRSYSVDMTYTLDRDLKDKDGNILYPKGYRFNPLNYMSLSIGLVVIDGSDPTQVKWFKDSPYSQNHRVKLLLSDGYAQELIGDINRAVFYLSKDVAKRFHLAAVPCIAVQQEKHIQVTEFLIEDAR